jgi:hypothetical protein
MLRRLGQPERLGRVRRRFAESAQLGETHDKRGAIEDRRRDGAAEIVENPVGRERR